MKKDTDTVRKTLLDVLSGIAEKKEPEDDKEEKEESNSLEDMLVNKVLMRLSELLEGEAPEETEDD
jgi:hypothetical protein